jgi:hypothetical protein
MDTGWGGPTVMDLKVINLKFIIFQARVAKGRSLAAMAPRITIAAMAPQIKLESTGSFESKIFTLRP